MKKQTFAVFIHLFVQVEALMERVEELTKDKVRLVEEYEAKLGKAQEYYERELEAMRRTHQLTTENLLAWKRTEVKTTTPKKCSHRTVDTAFFE